MTIDKDKYFIFDNLNKENGILHFYTKIPYNFSRKYVEKDKWDEEIKEIEQDFNYEFKCMKYMKQVHSANVIMVTKDNVDTECFEGYDGLLTNLKDVMLLTNTADCQAIFLYDRTCGVIGNIHSGWKGTLQKILRNAINMMKREYGCKEENIEVYINPSIMKCCFEVDIEVVDMFKEEFSDDVLKYITVGDYKDNKQKYYIDTIGINLWELESLGVLKDNVYVSLECTKCNSDVYHSYRVEGIGTGQNLAGIMMK